MNDPIVGQQIADLRPMTPGEMADYGWVGEQAPVVLVLGNGTTLIPSCDPEGNRPGVLFGSDADGDFRLSAQS